MYAQCPDCLTVFSLDVDILAQAGGHVSCGHCHADFDALASLTGQLPPEPFQRLPPRQPATGLPPMLELAVYRPQAEIAVMADGGAPITASTGPEDFSQLVFAPRFAREQRVRRKKSRRPDRQRRPAPTERRWPWVIACTVLALLLGAQLAWAKRDALIRDPAAGGWLRHACSLLHCTLPLVAAPRQLHLLASNVQAHPSVAGALMISANVRNDATFAQPYPVVTIILSNASGQHVAMRRLRPFEYLDDQAALHRGLAPGASTALLFEVEDPGDKAVSFDFSFE